MLRLRSFAVLLCFAALALGACTRTSGVQLDAEEALPPPEDIVSGVGTVQYVDLEGGFYGLVDDDSTRYVPQNLEEAYREDGLRVRFRAVQQDSAMTMQMWGTPIEMLDILRLDEDGEE